MATIHHINCLKIISPLTGNEAIGHCLLIEEEKQLALVDTGTGLLDAQNPLKEWENNLLIWLVLNLMKI